MGYIFVSYSRKQVYFAEAVALHLQRAGFEVWFDLQKLGPGVDWDSSLKDGYSNCEKLVLIASKAAFVSSYVQVEWEAALHSGREVIVVLTEAVSLPESLRACPIYDARTHFDRTIESLIAYLRGEAPARHDAVPVPGRFPLPLTMPPSIWFTIFVMALPAITVWVTAAFYPPEGYQNLYAWGFVIGLVLLAQLGIPGVGAFRRYPALVPFWRCRPGDARGNPGQAGRRSGSYVGTGRYCPGLNGSFLCCPLSSCRYGSGRAGCDRVREGRLQACPGGPRRTRIWSS